MVILPQDEMGYQSMFVRLPNSVARRVRAFLESSDPGYASFDEFAEVAFVNQLNAEGAISASVGFDGDSAHSSRPHLLVSRATERLSKPVHEQENASLMQPLGEESPLELAAPGGTSQDRLFVLTNRLSQLKVAVRVCANQAVAGTWPELKEFHRRSAETAREVGIALQNRASEKGFTKNGSGRLAIGYPTGPDAVKAMARFSNSFTIGFSEKGTTGPMAILGLADVVRGRVVLTEIGWRFAAAPAALTHEAAGELLSDEEAAILRARLRAAHGEMKEIGEFLGLVRRSHGSQHKVDDFLNQNHPEWNRDYVIAHRAAMAGRLSDVGVLKVQGRGQAAAIEVLPAAAEFENA